LSREARVDPNSKALIYIFLSRLRTPDPASESPLGRFSYYYVPRDEAFEDLKKESYVAGTLKVIMHELLPQIESALTKENEFNCFTDIDRLYKESVTIEERQPDDAISKVFKAVLPGLDSVYKRIPRFLETLEDSINLRFSPPHSYASELGDHIYVCTCAPDDFVTFVRNLFGPDDHFFFLSTH
jgi:hypothetical protein